ncbi:hypothetical protein DICPUDRAFT_150717 [Dictyostelium purpureum]|uniref:VPS9 domain-containing protein n=1 Tax=Dictyostelium purpureum TaxID=5786 RepID=F0ZH26_DICPU|nr:uncharacterized protein DICPUDRAFT_150717 [Dictyostelium purpureum]EGC36758.1 hypothetical protein DICPUDRAFT_150717 [Dictyostelium purpureum]|eukprot:XP_003286704.1 hypothetical protein DICPUDRAFT_150717 [Dictyostelium purpureum]
MWFGSSLLSGSFNNNNNNNNNNSNVNNSDNTNNNNNMNNNNNNNNTEGLTETPKKNMTKTNINDEFLSGNGISSSQSCDSLSNLGDPDFDVKSNSSNSSSHVQRSTGNGSGAGGSEPIYENIRIGNGSISTIITLEESTKERNNFYTKLKSPKAMDIRRSLLSFVTKFSEYGPANYEEQGHIIITYSRELEHKILLHPLWQDPTEAELEGIRDGIEKYIMNKLYHCTFFPARLGRLEPQEGNIVSESLLVPTEDDLKLYKHIMIHQFLEPQHFDIEKFFTVNEQRQNLAISELKKMNTYKTPRDKMVCVYNCCKVIFKLLKNTNNNPTGADEFLPILIYVVLKANLPMLKSNLIYVSTFRDQSRMMTEIACYFTHLVSAVTFIENISTPADLSIEESEFYRLREKYEMELPLKLNSDMLKRLNYKLSDQQKSILANSAINNTQPQSQPQSTPVKENNNTSNISKSPPHSNSKPLQPNSRGHSRHSSLNNSNISSHNTFFNENEDIHSSCNSPNVMAEHFSNFSTNQSHHYEFLNYHSDDIKIGQIPKLLEDYKKLIIENNILKSKLNNGNNPANNNFHISEPSSLSSSPALSRNNSTTWNNQISPNLLSNNKSNNNSLSSKTILEEEQSLQQDKKEKEKEKEKESQPNIIEKNQFAESPNTPSSLSSLLD